MNMFMARKSCIDSNLTPRSLVKLVLLVASSMMLSTGAYAAGDAKAGEAASATCAACHGADGNSTIPTNPKLAGQYESYLVQALKSYRSGERQSAIMSGFASGLSDQQIADLAAYFSSQKSSLQTVVER